MKECLNCKRHFEPNRWWQDFCKTQCRQEFHRAKYRAERIEVSRAVNDVVGGKLKVTEGLVGPLVERAKLKERRIEQRINGHRLAEAQRERALTKEEERKEVGEVLARIIRQRIEKKFVRRI